MNKIINNSTLIGQKDFFLLIRKICQGCAEETSTAEYISFLRQHIFCNLGQVCVEIYFYRELEGCFDLLTYPPLSPQKMCPHVPTRIPREPQFVTPLQEGHRLHRVFTAESGVPSFLATTGNASHALFPVFTGENLRAVLYVGSKAMPLFAEDYLLGIETVATIIGNQIKNIDSIANLRKIAAIYDHAETLQQALYDISEQAHLASSEEDLYRSLHAIVGRLINARNFFIALRRERDGEHFIQFVYYCDEFDSYLQGREFKIDPKEKLSMSAFLLQSGKPLLLGPDFFDEFCRMHGIQPIGTKAHSLVGAPFYLEHLSGVVLVQSYSLEIYTEKDKDLLVYVARHIGDALSRKKAIDDLREANEIFSLFLRYSPVHVYIKEVKDEESRLVKASEAYGASLRKSYGELLGRSMTDLFPTAFAGKTLADDLQVLKSGVPLQTEDYVDGRTYSTIKFPIIREGQSLLAGYSIDITERKRMEEALRESEQRYRIIFEKSPLAVVSFNAEGIIVDCNEKFIDMMGSTREKLLGFNTVKQSNPKMRETLKKALAGELAAYDDSYTSITGGKTTYLRGLFSPVAPNRSPTEVIATLEDITELKKHEKEQQRLEKLDSLGILAGGIAHDFNNILTGIMGNISFLQVLIEEGHKAHKPLVEAEKASRRAAELAHQLLTFARGGEPNKKTVSLQLLIKDAISLMLRGSNIRSIVNITAELHAIQADEGQISQVFNNLIINAAQAMPGGGNLTITAENEFLPKENRLGLRAGTYVRLHITDEGCGIPPDTIEKIFDPYFSTKASGTGLGLATAYSIILRHNGAIKVNSTSGTGTTFTIYLPSMGEASGDFLPAPRRNDTLHEGGAILVMDDEEMIRDIATAMLKHLGYEVTTCASGEEAIELYRTAMQSARPYCAVIMDLTIPGGLGGRQTAEQLLALAPSAYLIVSSGYSNDPIMANFKKYGFRAAIAKPYSISEFEQILSAVPTPDLFRSWPGDG